MTAWWAAGFLGSHLCKLLLEHNGNKVICLDNFFTGKIDNLRELESNPNFKIVSHDITDPLIGKISEHVDEIYNLACPASPIHYQFDPIETINLVEPIVKGSKNDPNARTIFSGLFGYMNRSVNYVKTYLKHIPNSD